MLLGNFPFTIATAAYNSLQRKSKARWARIPLLGGGEALHAVGVDHDTITLSGTVHPEVPAKLTGGAGLPFSALEDLIGTRAIDELRDTLKETKPLLFTSILGTSLGYWIMTDLQNRDSEFRRNTPKRQEFQLSLRYYGETPV